MRAEVGHFSRPRLGELVGGDLALARTDERYVLAAVVDVLGHGPEAHEAGETAGRYLADCQPGRAPAEVLAGLHQALIGSRGAAAIVLRFDSDTGLLTLAGVGNVTLRVIGPEGSRVQGRGGILGEVVGAFQEQQRQLASGDHVLVYTDGVSDRFPAQPGGDLLEGGAREVARRVVYRHGKDQDDATCLALRVST
jgi:serine phosphatase RsbU (regulator of sigma subunit)